MIEYQTHAPVRAAAIHGRRLGALAYQPGADCQTVLAAFIAASPYWRRAPDRECQVFRFAYASAFWELAQADIAAMNVHARAPR